MRQKTGLQFVVWFFAFVRYTFGKHTFVPRLPASWILSYGTPWDCISACFPNDTAILALYHGQYTPHKIFGSTHPVCASYIQELLATGKARDLWFLFGTCGEFVYRSSIIGERENEYLDFYSHRLNRRAFYFPATGTFYWDTKR